MSAAIDAALERAPAAALAVVADPDYPAWQTVYGTEAGRQLLPPRRAMGLAAVQGPEPTLIGAWRAAQFPVGVDAPVEAVYAPHGRVFATFRAAGVNVLRVYAPNLDGDYVWASVTGAPANPNHLAILDGRLWVGTLTGLHVRDLETNAWSVYNTTNSPLPSNAIRRLRAVDTPSDAGYLLIITNNGVAKYVPGRPPAWDIINTADGLPSMDVIDVGVHITGANGTTTHTWFLLRMPTNFVQLSRWNGASWFTANLAGCGVINDASQLVVDQAGRAWFDRQQEVPALAAQSDNAPHAPAAPAAPTVPAEFVPLGPCVYVGGAATPYNTTYPGLPSDDITDLSLDGSGRVWMSFDDHDGHEGGAAVFDSGNWEIFREASSPLTASRVIRAWTLGEAIWFAYAGAAPFTVHSPNWLRWPFSALDGVPGPIHLGPTQAWAGAGTKLYTYAALLGWVGQAIPGNTPDSLVTALTYDGANRLWIGTSKQGVFSTFTSGPANGTFTHDTSANGLPGNAVNALLTDHLGRVWVGTSAGLALRAGAGYWVTFTTSSAPMLSNDVTALAQDAEERLWIGTRANGISIFDLGASDGSDAWTQQTITRGLPSNVIHALARDTYGRMWVATDGGLAMKETRTATWQVFSPTLGGLPSARVTGLAPDPRGSMWVATDGGAAQYQGITWLPFHAPGTMVESNRIRGIAADGKRAWVAAESAIPNTGAIAARGILTSPIGNAVPFISSFTPAAAIPGGTVFIVGGGFDTRGAAFNTVRFGDVEAEVVSVVENAIAVKAPWLASSDRLYVEANGLKSLPSAATFQLKPSIFTLNDTCVGLGDELRIFGLGFLDHSAPAYVRIGNGPERVADATNPNLVRVFIRPGDTAGPVRVRLANGQQDISSQNVSLTALSLVGTRIQQGIEDTWMVWGKTTLVQPRLVSQGCGAARLTSANMVWRFNDGWTMPGNASGDSGTWKDYPGGKAIPTTIPQSPSLDDAVSFDARLDIAWPKTHFDLPPFVTTLAFFDGAVVTFRNNNVTLFSYAIARNQFPFVDTSLPLVRRHFHFVRVTGNSPDKQDPDYFESLYENFATIARAYPQIDYGYLSGSFSWLHHYPSYIITAVKVFIDPENGNHDEVRDHVDDLVDPDGNTWAVAMIDELNKASGSKGGISSDGWTTVVAVNQRGYGGRYGLHELMHAFGFVDEDATNYVESDAPGEDHHSKYNEGKWNNIANCNANLSFDVAIADQLGGNQRVIRLGDGTFEEMNVAACVSAADAYQDDVAKSVISYAPNRNNRNIFLEPLDYHTAIVQICGATMPCPGPALLPLTASSAQALAPTTPSAEPTRTLRLSGRIDAAGRVTPSLSYVAVNDGAVTPQTPGADYHLIVRSTSGNVLHDQAFDLPEPPLAPHDGPTLHAAASPHHAVTGTHSARFHVRVPFPPDAVLAEIRHHETLLWQKRVSANPPSVSWVMPNGGTFNAANVVNVTWAASDADNDRLQFGLDYSPDNGLTWIVVAPRITGTQYAWTPGYMPPSSANSARLRVRASDGLNTAVATSTLFTLVPLPPQAIILAPDGGQSFTEGEMLVLRGTSHTASGPGVGAFEWRKGATSLGLTHTVTTTLGAIGLHTYTLYVTANGATVSRSVTVTVVPDYDGDQLPNTWESLYALNPLDAGDASADGDRDGLTNLGEHQHGTHPGQADTDGDGATDSAEVDAGTDPLNAVSEPLTTPVLNVGSVSMGFTLDPYHSLPGPHHTWVTNGGGGALSWTATKDAPWLAVSPTSGSTPHSITVSYTAQGLAAGVYQGHIIVSATAPSASGSPHTITVTLRVEGLPERVYVPIATR